MAVEVNSNRLIGIGLNCWNSDNDVTAFFTGTPPDDKVAIIRSGQLFTLIPDREPPRRGGARRSRYAFRACPDGIGI